MTVATEIFILLSAFYVMNKTVRLKLNFTVAAKAAGASLVMAVALAWLAAWRFELLLIVGVVTYFLALYWLKGLPRQTLAEIIRIKPHADAKN